MLTVIGGQGNGVSRGHTARNNGNFVHFFTVVQIFHNNGMTRFMISGNALIIFINDTAFLFGSGNDTLDGFFHFGHADIAFFAAGRQQSRFVHQIFQIGAGKAGRTFGNHTEIDSAVKGFVLFIDIQDGLTPFDIGNTDCNLTVKTTGTKKRRV